MTRAARNLGWLAPIAASVLVARRILMVVRVDGPSMLPTFAPGDLLLALRAPFSGPVRPDTVVVLAAPTPAPLGPAGSRRSPETLIKRVAHVEQAPDGTATVFVEGDNRPSYDSHVFGLVPAASVLGRVLTVVSSDRVGRFGRTGR